MAKETSVPTRDAKTRLPKPLDEKKRNVGRPRGSAPLLTPKFLAAFLKHVSRGIPIQTISEMMGVSKSTIYDWRQKGAEDLAAGRDTLYGNFSDGLTRGLASVRGEMVAQIVKAARTEWRAALAYLERRDPDQWSQKRALEHSGEITVDSPADRAAVRIRMDRVVEYMASDEGCAEADRISDEMTRVARLKQGFDAFGHRIADPR
jgi:transposase